RYIGETNTEIGRRAKPTDISSAQVGPKLSETKRRTTDISNGWARRTMNGASGAASIGGSFNRFTSKSGINVTRASPVNSTALFRAANSGGSLNHSATESAARSNSAPS